MIPVNAENTEQWSGSQGKSIIKSSQHLTQPDWEETNIFLPVDDIVEPTGLGRR